MPRFLVKQTSRSTFPFDTVEDYYRKNTFISLLDVIISGFNQRFFKNTVPIEVWSSLLPHKICQLDAEELQRVKSHSWFKYSELLN
jgi:hypothetical protein